MSNYTAEDFSEKAVDAAEMLLRTADIRRKQFNSPPHEHDRALVALAAITVANCLKARRDQAAGTAETYLALFKQELDAQLKGIGVLS